MSIRLENRYCQWLIAADGRNLRFADKISGRDWLIAEPPSACAYVRKGGWRSDACAASFDGRCLHLRFAEGAVSARVAVALHEAYMLFTVEELLGDVDELAFVSIPTKLRVAADEPFSASMISLGLQSNVELLPGPQDYLWTAAYRRFAFVGAQSGLVTAPFAEMREHMQRMVSQAPGVPHSPFCGPWALDAEEPRRSNVFGSPTEDNVDEWIAFCQELGIGAIEFDGAINYGDYQPRAAIYPRGYASVKAVTDRLHAAGILAGLHTMSFSIAKNCAWVTPVPDPRLAKERSYTLATDCSAEDSDILLQEGCGDLPERINYYIRRSMTLQIDDELIEYRLLDPAAGALRECRRGIHGTTPAAHRAGAKVHHLKECWGCYAPNGDSSLFDEVAGRIADCIDQCGFDFCYLDGLDGAHIIGGEEARWHYGAKFTFSVFRQLRKPIMMEMATFHHHLWYVRTRMQAWDHCKRAHKRFLGLHLRSNEQARRLMLPLHLGWAGLFPWTNSEQDPTYWDDIEYMWSKALATEANFTLQCVSPSSLQQGAWLKRLAPSIRAYEELRQQDYFPPTLRSRLRELDDEFQLERLSDGEWAFRPLQSARHKIEDCDGPSKRWSYHNRFAAQPAALRIVALPAVAPYDAEDGVTLVDFSSDKQFCDPGESITILNSGKLYVYPSAAPGLSSAVTPAMAADGPVAACGRWSARNAGSQELVCSSAADDSYSLLDHCEREYRLRRAAWTSLWHGFAEPKDLSAQRALGLWVKGDGKGELLNIILNSRSYGETYAQHYIRLDFSGWRYVELVEPEAERFDGHSWPFLRGQYGVYRTTTNFASCRGIFLWGNDIPEGEGVSCLLSPIRALPLREQPLARPQLLINGRRVIFPVDMLPGQHIEYRAGASCRLYDGNGNELGELTPEEPDGSPELTAADNALEFTAEPGPCRSRAYVTMFSWGDELLRR
jgi:hypothetical protein